MSVLVLPAGRDGAGAPRFTPVVIDGELTVWDAELQRHVIHEACWDEEAACLVANHLTEHHNYVSVWNWSQPWASTAEDGVA